MRKLEAALLMAVFMLLLPAILSGQDDSKNSILLIAYDQLVHPGGRILIKAKLVSQGMVFRNRPVSGERVEFSIGGKSAGIGLTGGDGVAVKEIPPLPQGEYSITLRLKTAQYGPAETSAILAVWELDPKILIVNLAAAMDEKEGSGPSILEPRIEMAPRPDAAAVLKRLAREYHILFFTEKEEALLAGTRAWLASQKFPMSPLMAWKFGPGPATHELVLEEELKGLRAAGWTNLKVGIGATALDAEPFLNIGLKTIILTGEKENGLEMPAGTIKANDWKTVERFVGKIQGP